MRRWRRPHGQRAGARSGGDGDGVLYRSGYRRHPQLLDRHAPAPRARSPTTATAPSAYDPNGAFASLKAGATATDTFHYTVTDGSGFSTATVTITITGQNDAPVAAGLTANVQEHGPATTVTASYTDPDIGDTHSFSVDTHRHQGQGHRQRQRHLHLRPERRLRQPEGGRDRDRHVPLYGDGWREPLIDGDW